MKTKAKKVFLYFMNTMVLIMLFLLMGTIAQAKAPKDKEPSTKEINQALDLSMEYTYPTVGYVTKIKGNKVYISEAGGNLFVLKCKQAKDFYHKGDVLAIVMYTNMTWDDETDDVIIKSINYGK